MSYKKLDLKIASDMTPTAKKLYQYAASQKLPAAVSIADFQRLCGLEGAVSGWQEEVERVCRELVSANVVKNAYVADGVIHFQ